LRKYTPPIYGVVSYSVSRRTPEIGIRMALGASASELRMGIILQTFGLTAIGTALGAAVSWAFALGGFLFGVTSTDPVRFLAMAAIFSGVALIGGYLPATGVAHRSDGGAAIGVGATTGISVH
jgi:ABC-type antimicrobial peptide transport system permease subunit